MPITKHTFYTTGDPALEKAIVQQKKEKKFSVFACQALREYLERNGILKPRK